MGAKHSPRSEEFWNTQCRTYSDWAMFMLHDYDSPSRQMAYGLLESYLPGSFGEIGFGDLHDFEACFKDWHDEGLISYVGHDIIPRFVQFAKWKFPGYEFRVADFLQIEQFDITYTRHTLEHVALELMRPSLQAMLQATRKVAVQTWFLRPSCEHIRYDGAWLNAYNQEDVEEVIAQEGFQYWRHEVPDSAECIYVMERRT